MKRVLICHIVPRHLTHKLKVSQAQNNFCYNLLESGVFKKAVSLVPLSVWFDKYKEQEAMVDYFISSKQSTCLIGRVWNYIMQSIKLANSVKRYDSIWFYNLFNLSLLVYLLLKYVYRKDIYVILTDYTPASRKFSVQTVIKYCIENSKGMINLSERSVIHHFNVEFIAGIVPSYKICKKILPLHSPIKILFSGTLVDVTGFPMALKVFKQVSNVELYISGNGEVEDLSMWPHIHFYGMCSFDEYLNLLNECDVCLNFRNPNLPENQNNFPSKVLEYLSYNKVVVSTISYPELNGVRYLYVDYNEADLIQLFTNLDGSKLSVFQDNREAILNTFSECGWIKAIKSIEGYAKYIQ